jgi:hypothetical protein
MGNIKHNNGRPTGSKSTISDIYIFSKQLEKCRLSDNPGNTKASRTYCRTSKASNLVLSPWRIQYKFISERRKTETTSKGEENKCI